MTWFAYLLLLLGLSWAGVGIFRWYALDLGMIDEPNERSSHIAPTPRGGGVIFFVGWVLLLLVLYFYHYLSIHYVWLFLPAILVGFVGFWDDHQEVSALFRFIVQCCAAVMSLLLSGVVGDFISMLLPFSLPISACFAILVLAIVWMTNIFNFMDGTDGFAAMEGMFVFGVSGYLLYQVHAYELMVLGWGLVALLAGFLIWNWPTARIFMGDSGSYFLGFMTALYALISYEWFQIPLQIWIILTGLFWFDATVTLIRRLLAGEEWRKPHRRHAYQRLIQAGWSHQKVLLAACIVNSILAFLAIIAFRDPRLIHFSIGLAIALLSIVYLIVELIKPMFLKHLAS